MLMPKTKFRLLPIRELRFALVFVLTFAVLQTAYTANRGGVLEHIVIDVATVCPSAAIINLIDPKKKAMANGQRIVSPQGSISILNGCEGTETVFLLTAALAAFQASWKNRLKGVLLGAGLVYCLNQARIVTLFFASHENRRWFDMIHGIIAPSLIIVLGSLYFLWWAKGATDDESKNAA